MKNNQFLGDFITTEQFCKRNNLKFNTSNEQISFLKKLRLSSLTKIGNTFFLEEKEGMQCLAKYLISQKQLRIKRRDSARLRAQSEKIKQQDQKSKIQEDAKKILTEKFTRLKTNNFQIINNVETSRLPGQPLKFPADNEWLANSYEHLTKLKTKQILTQTDVKFIQKFNPDRTSEDAVTETESKSSRLKRFTNQIIKNSN